MMMRTLLLLLQLKPHLPLSTTTSYCPSTSATTTTQKANIREEGQKMWQIMIHPSIVVGDDDDDDGDGG